MTSLLRKIGPPLFVFCFFSGVFLNCFLESSYFSRCIQGSVGRQIMFCLFSPLYFSFAKHTMVWISGIFCLSRYQKFCEEIKFHMETMWNRKWQILPFKFSLSQPYLIRTPADKACVWLRVILSQIAETWKQGKTTELNDRNCWAV